MIPSLADFVIQSQLSFLPYYFFVNFFFAFIYYCSFVFTLGVSFVFFTSQETWPWPLMDWGLMGGSFGLPLGSRMGLFSLSFLFQRNFRMLSILPSSLSHRDSSFGGHIHLCVVPLSQLCPPWATVKATMMPTIPPSANKPSPSASKMVRR